MMTPDEMFPLIFHGILPDHPEGVLANKGLHPGHPCPAAVTVCGKRGERRYSMCHLPAGHEGDCQV